MKDQYDFVEQGRINVLKRWNRYPKLSDRRRQTAFGGFMSVFYAKGEDAAISWLQRVHGADPPTVELVLVKYQSEDNQKKILDRTGF